MSNTIKVGSIVTINPQDPSARHMCRDCKAGTQYSIVSISVGRYQCKGNDMAAFIDDADDLVNVDVTDLEVVS